MPICALISKKLTAIKYQGRNFLVCKEYFASPVPTYFAPRSINEQLNFYTVKFMPRYLLEFLDLEGFFNRGLK